jgi:DNA-binding PadR family transcriptional regulator
MELKGQVDLLLLSALTQGPAHGYGLIQRLRDRSEGVLDYADSTVYAALRRLERAGLLTSRLRQDAVAASTASRAAAAGASSGSARSGPC